MRAMLPSNSGLSQWRINVANRSKIYGAWTVKYPSVTNLKKISTDGQQEYAVIPSGLNGGAGEGQHSGAHQKGEQVLQGFAHQNFPHGFFALMAILAIHQQEPYRAKLAF